MQDFIPLDLDHRHDMVLVLSAHMSNPNGDPDGDNSPRINPYDGHGIITGVSIKRKVRDYVQDARQGQAGFRLMVRHGGVIASEVYGAMKDAGVGLVETLALSRAQVDELREHGEILGNAFVLGEQSLNYDKTLRAREVTSLVTRLEAAGVDPALARQVLELGTRKQKDSAQAPSRTEVYERAGPIMVRECWDSRTFGYTAPDSAGKLRGPVQVADGLSIAPINVVDQTLTRVARGTSTAEKDGTANFARRQVVDHAVYRVPCFYNPTLRASSGLSQEDLTLFVEGLYYGQSLARSSARPDMRVEALVIFSHGNRYGAAPTSRLNAAVEIRHSGHEHVEVSVNRTGIPDQIGIQVLR